MDDSITPEYLWSETSITFALLSSLYNPFKFSKEVASVEPTALHLHFCSLSITFKEQLGVRGSDMMAVFYIRPGGRFIEIKHIRREKLQIMNRGSSFLGESFARDIARTPIQ